MKFPRRTSLLLLLILLVTFPASAAQGAEELSLKQKKEPQKKKENILSLIFSPPPPMATERGILVIDAFHDRNGNSQRDKGEEDVRQEVFCLVDDIEYEVPAFIPGLSYESSYQILCAGDAYKPARPKEELFIRRRGEIIRIDLPCSKMASYAGGQAGL